MAAEDCACTGVIEEVLLTENSVVNELRHGVDGIIIEPSSGSLQPHLRRPFLIIQIHPGPS
jgi:hypothetical protein